MLNFPSKTEFNKRIPKEKFYLNGKLTEKEKSLFVSDIKKIVWQNKFSEQTIGLLKGSIVEEIEVLNVQLKSKNFNEKILSIIKNTIPYNILFVIDYEDERKLALFHTKLFQTEWEKRDDVAFEIIGMDLDAVWANFVVQVGNIEIEGSRSLEQQIQSDQRKLCLQKEIARLEKIAWKEKQPKKKFELVQQIKLLETEIKNMAL